jgi:hypothetical protein
MRWPPTRMHFISFSILFLLSWVAASGASPLFRRRDSSPEKRRRSYDVPIMRRSSPRGPIKRDGIAGSIGIGDNSDLLYTIPIEIGQTTAVVNLDTGSNDLWVLSAACETALCLKSTVTRYPAPPLSASNTSVTMLYGDSTTGTYASGPVIQDVVTVAGISLPDQVFASIDNTTNPTISSGSSGICGLGFPSGSEVLNAVVNQQFDNPSNNNDLVKSFSTYGPVLSRAAMYGELEDPMFSITLQRDTVEIGGKGVLSVGKLPDGVDNSSITWVPVRLYTTAQGGMEPPTTLPHEVYPLRWEIEIDGVYLDGNKLPDSTIAGATKTVSALIDTGNSLIRGPSDVVNNILTTVSSSYAANSQNSPTLPCLSSHTLAFMIGGKLFKVNPLDFISPSQAGDDQTCVADNVVATDPPSVGSLFSWSLGDPFMKSTVVAFHYGNLTNPSVDPPRIGLLSNVPDDTSGLLSQAVQDAKTNGGNFESTIDFAPTASAAAAPQVTITGSAIPTASFSPGAKSALGSQATDLSKPKQSSASLSQFIFPSGLLPSTLVFVMLLWL